VKRRRASSSVQRLTELKDLVESLMTRVATNPLFLKSDE